ncbi:MULTISPECIES: hypothetical protein [Bacillaceae]|uniref:hypothetical protein n=1 Tax=Bacillaceae TaxID=186817 RepID=UPI000E74A630|nr:hypothetical protein [Bacillus sp. PK3_68]RJS58771.1 hypothetical protein CJ483_00705 [Bacillus sp. PK3_68]
MFIIYQSILPFFLTTITLLIHALTLKRFPKSVGGQLAGFAAPLSIGFVVDAAGGSFFSVARLLVGCVFSASWLFSA